MTSRVILCTTDDTCPRHGQYIYFCPQCHSDWEAANPRTVAAIAGGFPPAAIRQAQKEDRADS